MTQHVISAGTYCIEEVTWLALLFEKSRQSASPLQHITNFPFLGKERHAIQQEHCFLRCHWQPWSLSCTRVYRRYGSIHCLVLWMAQLRTFLLEERTSSGESQSAFFGAMLLHNGFKEQLRWRSQGNELQGRIVQLTDP